MKEMRKSGWRRLVSWLFTLALVLSIVNMPNQSLKVQASDIRVIIDRQMFLDNVRARLSGDTADMSIENIKIADKVPETVQSTVPLNSSGTVVSYVVGDTLYIAPKYEGDTVALPVDASYMFYELKYIKYIDLSGLDTSSVVNMEGFVCGNPFLETLNLEGVDTSNVENMQDAFSCNKRLQALDVTGFNTSKVQNMVGMFGDDESITQLDVSSFDTSSVTDMGGMFGNCWELETLDVSGFDTSKVTDMSGMFWYCKALQTLDLSNFDTSKVTNMDDMFYYAGSLETVNTSSFDTSQVTGMRRMFEGCKSLKSLDLSNFDTSKVQNMHRMFQGCKSLKNLDIGGFCYNNVDASRVHMFLGDCINLQSLNLGDFPVDKFRDTTDKFTNCSPRYICCPPDVYEKILPEIPSVITPQLHHFSGQPYYYIGKATHFRKCEFCGIDDELEDCVGGEVTCEHGKICEKCHTEYTKKREHEPQEAVKENVVEATYDTPDSYDMVVYCGLCNKELSRECFTGSVLPKEDEPIVPVDPKDPSNQEDVKPVKPSTPGVASVTYRTHVQTFGWQDYVSNGVMAGTSGKAKRLEGINIRVQGVENLGIQYTTHVQTYGWLPWASDGAMSGTEGEAKRLEAIMIKLTGSAASNYDVYYRVHAQTYGWLAWAKNGAPAGTAGLGKRLEAIQIVIVKKGAKINQNMAGITSDNASAYIQRAGTGYPVVPDSSLATVTYRTHVQTYGWQGWKYNGNMSGTSGEAKRLEAINIKLTNTPYSGSVQYRTHIQSYGWENTWKQDGQLSGTSGKGKRLEAIQIRLTGDMAKYYDIYYRVHAQSYGWLGWAKNGESAGTEGLSKRLEGIEIVLVPKGGDAPRSEKPFVK